LSRTVSSRIPKELHEELLERCNRVGCTINDFVQAAIEFAINDTTEFDFGEPEEEDVGQFKLSSSSKPTPKAQIVEIIND